MSISLLSTTPTVSVVMPVYNVESFIEQAVNSVVTQSYADFELLIIDDESPDDSIQLIQPLLGQDARIRVIKQENRGLAGARNTGIREARGKYIAFLDSDDFWHEDKLMRHVEQLEAEPKCGVVFSASMFVNEAGESINKVQSPNKKSSYTARDIFCRNPIGNGSAPVIRKNVLEQIAFTGTNKHGVPMDYWQYFDESLKQSEDIDCWTRLALSTATGFSLIDEPLTFYRLNNEGLSADVEAQYKTWLLFIEKLAENSPRFIDKHASSAKAFQCRYLARRCISQADGKLAFRWVMRACRHNFWALLAESKRTLSTIAVSMLLACLPKNEQKKLVSIVI